MPQTTPYGVVAERSISTEKDNVEQDLEKLVFGDNAGFHENLKRHGPQGQLAGWDDAASAWRVGPPEKDEDEDDLEGVNDSDVGALYVLARLHAQRAEISQLFFLDSGPSDFNVPSLLPSQRSENDVSEAEDRPAWADSDDERIVVSLASNPRLRKLRATEAEDLVNGKEYSKRLRRQFERLYPVPEWANPSARTRIMSKRKKRRSTDMMDTSDLDSADDHSDESDELSAQPLAKLLQDASSLGKLGTQNSESKRRLRPGVIDIHRLKDVGSTQPSAITCLTFHPQHPLLLTSGPSALLSLFRISPDPPHPNPLVTDLHIRGTPLETSLFLPPHGNKIFFSGDRRYFHTWDLDAGKVQRISKVIGHKDEQKSMKSFKLSPCGRWMGLVGSPRKGGGYINVVDARTCQWVAEARVEGNGGVADFDWWGNGEGLVALGKGGEAIEYSLVQRRVIARWIDEGAVGTTIVALGGRKVGPKELGGDRWLAVGSSSGIVNVYDRRLWEKADGVPARPKPTRVLDQLTTPSSHLAFSPDGQLLCMASRWKRDAMRLVHLPSCTVYKNWPTGETPLGRISAVGWSAGGEMLGVGNEQGKVRLFEVRG